MRAVSPEDIRRIPRRYAIGKRPLSLLLGWGELTYTRLLDGNTPTPQHADELRRLLDDPAIYARALETGRGRITGAAYLRSFRAVDELLSDEGGARSATKIFAVADAICRLAHGDITPGALQRLTYYAQGIGFARLKKPLFNDLPYASASGPAYRRIAECYPFDEIQRVSAEPPENSSSDSVAELGASSSYAVIALDRDVLSKEETEIIKLAYKRYGDYSSQALSQLSCSQAPWKKARKRASATSGQDCEEAITAKSMTKFFSKG